MESRSESPSCPYATSGNDVIYSTNITYWEDCRINSRAMAANLRSTSVCDTLQDEENFVPWFAPDDELAKAIPLRRHAYFANPSRILHRGINDKLGLQRAASQLLELQANYLAQHYPESYSVEDRSKFGRWVINKVTGDQFKLGASRSYLHPLAVSGLLSQEDICIVEQTDDGRHILAAGFVATPTEWELSQLVGKDMDQIHARFNGYEERLKKVVDDTLSHMPEFPAMKYRNNLFIDYKPNLSLFIDSDVTVNVDSITDPGADIALRSERETIIRLPSVDNKKRLVFTIKPHVLPLSETVLNVSHEKLKKIIDAIQKNTVLHRDEKLADVALNYLSRHMD